MWTVDDKHLVKLLVDNLSRHNIGGTSPPKENLTITIYFNILGDNYIVCVARGDGRLMTMTIKEVNDLRDFETC